MIFPFCILATNQPVVTEIAITATSIALRIHVYPMPEGNYTIDVTLKKLYPCSDYEKDYTINMTNIPEESTVANITELDVGSTYNISFVVTNEVDTATSNPIIATTNKTSKYYNYIRN